MDLAKMNQAFSGRDFISINDFTPEEIEHLLSVAGDLKAKQRKGIPHPYLAGKTLGMIFLKNSTRTRVSFEVGIYQLGGTGLFLSANDLQIGRGEPIKDTARVLSRYLDGIMIRTYSHDEILELAEYATIPIINGLTDLLHPCQAMADLLTIKEYKGELAGLKMTYVGDGNNMAHSLMFAGAKMAMEVAIAAPEGYMPDETITQQARAVAKETGGNLILTHDVKEATKDADIIYTDTWASMGQEEETRIRKEAFASFQVNQALLKEAKADVMILHCLPAYRGEEITDEVLEGSNSAIFDQAENRLHAQKAIMALLMG